MDPQLVKVIAVAGIAGGIGAVLALSSIAARRRREAFAALAARMGWAFDPDAVPHSPDFPLFARGRRRTRRNALSGRVEDIRAEIYDYHFTVSSGKNSHTHRQTVIDLRVPGLGAPAFALRPEHFGHRLAAVFGQNDIDLPDRPEFSRRWHVSGAVAPAIRAFLDDDALEAKLQSLEPVEIQVDGDRVLTFRAGRRIAAEEVEVALGQAVDLALAFAARTLPDPA